MISYKKPASLGSMLLNNKHQSMPVSERKSPPRSTSTKTIETSTNSPPATVLQNPGCTTEKTVQKTSININSTVDTTEKTDLTPVKAYKPRECKKCLVCGNYRLKTCPQNAKKFMLSTKKYIQDCHGKRIYIKEDLCCDDAGIYYLQCKICLEK